jgi:hypothetical protein
MTTSPVRTRSPRRRVRITAFWGNDDASATITLGPRRWQAILAGAEDGAESYAWYEGQRFRVGWSFHAGLVTIGGDDGLGCLADHPCTDLLVEHFPPRESTP